MDKYQNRQAAGKVLAQALQGYANRADVIVFALPRGGVPVAFEIAQALRAPLDVFIVRKLGVPGQVELAMGAIAAGGARVFNQDIIQDLQISKEEIAAVIAIESAELRRREMIYRGEQTLPNLKNQIVILVDDGIATGATMRAAIAALKVLQPARIVVAVPVAAKNLAEKIEHEVDEFICPMRPVNFQAVGAWYKDFSQTEDEEVYALLGEAKKRRF